MLCRNNRDTFLENIIAHFPAVFNNIWKMVAKSFCRDGAQVFPDKVGAIFCHLFVNFLGKKITGQQLVYETVHVFVVKSGTFATDRFGNQKAAVFRMFGVEGGRAIYLLIRSKIYQYIAYQRTAGNQLKKFLPMQRLLIHSKKQ